MGLSREVGKVKDFFLLLTAHVHINVSFSSIKCCVKKTNIFHAKLGRIYELVKDENYGVLCLKVLMSIGLGNTGKAARNSVWAQPILTPDGP